MKLIPKNWSDFQHYNKRTPPWIKLHRSLLDDFDYQRLPVASRAIAPMLWLLASEKDGGEFDASTDYLMFRLRCSEKDIIDGLKPLIDNGFFKVASGALSSRYQDSPLETEGETEGEKRYMSKPEGFDPCPQAKILDLYHELCPSLPRVQKLTPARQQAIRARWRNELSTLDDWSRFFVVVSESKFLTGQAQPTGGRSKPFLADIDFLTKQGNVVKIMEGKYDD